MTILFRKKIFALICNGTSYSFIGSRGTRFILLCIAGTDRYILCSGIYGRFAGHYRANDDGHFMEIQKAA